MFKRSFFLTVAAAGLLLLAQAAQAMTIKPYSAADLAAAQNAGAPVAVHFFADWCPTCKAQSVALNSLKADPALDKVTLLIANYDTEKELRKTMAVRAQSALVVFKGKTEVARNGGDIDAGKLKATLMASLAK